MEREFLEAMIADRAARLLGLLGQGSVDAQRLATACAQLRELLDERERRISGRREKGKVREDASQVREDASQ